MKIKENLYFLILEFGIKINLIFLGGGRMWPQAEKNNI